MLCDYISCIYRVSVCAACMLYNSKVLINFSGNLALPFSLFCLFVLFCPQKCIVKEWASCTRRKNGKLWCYRENKFKEEKITFFHPSVSIGSCSFGRTIFVLLSTSIRIHAVVALLLHATFHANTRYKRHNFRTSRDQFSLCAVIWFYLVI